MTKTDATVTTYKLRIYNENVVNAENLMKQL
jgi:hypothetical protein